MRSKSLRQLYQGVGFQARTHRRDRARRRGRSMSGHGILRAEEVMILLQNFHQSRLVLRELSAILDQVDSLAGRTSRESSPPATTYGFVFALDAFPLEQPLQSAVKCSKPT